MPVYVSSHTGLCYGAAGRQAGRGGPRRAVAGRQAAKAGRNAPVKPLCGSFFTQPPDIAGEDESPLLNYWQPSFCCKHVKSNANPLPTSSPSLRTGE